LLKPDKIFQKISKVFNRCHFSTCGKSGCLGKFPCERFAVEPVLPFEAFVFRFCPAVGPGFFVHTCGVSISMARSNRRSFWKSFTRNFFGFFSRERAGQIASPVTRRKIGLEQLETRWVPATVSWANGVLALQSNIGETITAGTSADNVISYTTDQNFTFDDSVPVGFSGNTTASLTGDLTATSTVGITIIGSTGNETANVASGYSTTAANLTILAPFETVNQLGTATYQGLNISAVSTTLTGDVQVVGGDFDLRDTTTTIGANITINTAFGGASGGTLTMGSVDGPVGGALADLTLTSGSGNIGFSNALGLFRPSARPMMWPCN
jgi:hypothetical protein